MERTEREGGVEALRFVGELRFRECFASWERVRALAHPAPARMELDLSGVGRLDGAATALLLDLRNELAAAGVRTEIVGAANELLISPGLRDRLTVLAPPTDAP